MVLKKSFYGCSNYPECKWFCCKVLNKE
ncbi:hypothetical protein ACJK5A_00025 (plasmid) [Enterococcus faecalis]